jgi:branched-chain amino acid transport system permease protein
LRPVNEVIQHAINALSLGSLYALLALGVALIFGIIGLVNFAHGELIMVGAYAAFLVGGAPWPLIPIAALAVTLLFAVVMERIAFRPVRGADASTLLVTSFAVSYLLQSLALLIFESRAKSIGLEIFTESIQIGNTTITKLSIVTFVASTALVVGLVVFLRRARLGVYIRAAAEDFQMARALGVQANGVIVTGFAISGVLAGAASVLVIGQTGTITPTIGLTPVIVAFVATVIGGMGSLVGAVIGGYVLGVATVLLQALLPLELRPYRDAFVFLGVIFILVFRPQGIVTVKSRIERV